MPRKKTPKPPYKKSLWRFSAKIKVTIDIAAWIVVPILVMSFEPYAFLA